jgi:hypothetical protein
MLIKRVFTIILRTIIALSSRTISGSIIIISAFKELFLLIKRQAA